MTKKELLEAIKDMPEDAKVGYVDWSHDGGVLMVIEEVRYMDNIKCIGLC